MTHNSRLVRALLFYSLHLPNHRGKAHIVERLRKMFRLTVNQQLEVERSGLRWSINPSGDFIQSGLFWMGMYNYWEIYHLSRILRSPSVIFDIGANLGYYSMTLATQLKGNCQVHAFEPNPPTYKRLNKNIALNNLHDVVIAHNVGCGDVSGTASMTEKPFNSPGATMVHVNESEGVFLTTIDQFVDSHSITQIDFMKVDVEGFEERVLRGAAAILNRFQPILLVEIDPKRLAFQGSSAEAVLRILKLHGYRTLVPQRSLLKPLERIPTGPGETNVFCFPSQNPTKASKPNTLKYHVRQLNPTNSI